MKKVLIVLGILFMNGTLISCSNDDDHDLDTYQTELKLYGTGGEDGDTPPPPPPPGGN